MNVSVLLFENFETLDVFGPVEILGRLKDHYAVFFYSEAGGLINNLHGVAIDTLKLNTLRSGTDIFIIPGGMGTRSLVKDQHFIQSIRDISDSSRFVLTICTGSALLAKTGLLDGKRATSNKRAFEWVKTQGEKVNWIRQARWTVDGKYYTSSGVSAGMDMTLGFLTHHHGYDFAKTVANQIEYTWQEDKDKDDFAQLPLS